jgi:hypothetical protein
VIISSTHHHLGHHHRRYPHPHRSRGARSSHVALLLRSPPLHQRFLNHREESDMSEYEDEYDDVGEEVEHEQQ